MSGNTAQHYSGTATPIIVSNHTSSTSSTTIPNVTSLHKFNTNTVQNTNSNISSLFRNDVLNSQKNQIVTTISPESSTSISTLHYKTPSCPSSSAAKTKLSSLPVMPQMATQQLAKPNTNYKDKNAEHHKQQDGHQHHQHHEPMAITNNIQTKYLSNYRKSVHSTKKSFKEINHNNLNNSNNNNCSSNNFTEIMQRVNNIKRLSPSQESSNMSFSSTSVTGSIQDDVNDKCGLTKAGLEEYIMRSNSFYDNPVLYHHQKQPSYAQSEGYHSYVSSSDSTSATPMLDRLRQESELLLRHASTHQWSRNDLSAVATTSAEALPASLLNNLGSSTEQQLHKNSSEGTSSTETLRWLGSMSDVSEVSDTTTFSAISESATSSQLIVHSSRVLTPKRHQSENVLYTTEETPHQQQEHPCRGTPQSPQRRTNTFETQTSSFPLNNSLIPTHRHNPSYQPIDQTSHTLNHYQKSMIELTSSNNTPFNSDGTAQKSNISVTISNSATVVTISPNRPPVPTLKPYFNSNICNEIHNTTTNTIPASKSQITISVGSHNFPVQTSSLDSMVDHKSVSASTDSLSDIKYPYRTNSVSNSTELVRSNTSHFFHHPNPQYGRGLQNPKKSQQLTTTTAAASSSLCSSSLSGSCNNVHQPKLSSPNYPQASSQSVAALINDFERTNDQQQSQKYTYLDPNKTHRLPNPALKVFQKNAVQSYFERQQQQKQYQHHNQNHVLTFYNASPKSYQEQHQSPLANSLQESVQTVLIRNSPANYYTTTTVQRPSPEEKNYHSPHSFSNSPSPAPPPPPPRSRSIIPTLLRRSSSGSDYPELRDKITASSQKKQSQSIKNISNSEKLSFNDCGMPPPPPPPPRDRPSIPTRRTSSATDHVAIRDKVLFQQAAVLTHKQLHPYQHEHLNMISSTYHHPTHLQLLLPQSQQTNLDMVSSPFQDCWVPERPPKSINLRVPSPDLPPPPPGLESEIAIPDEPLPPPPPEILKPIPLLDCSVDLMSKRPSHNRRNSFAGASTRKSNFFTTSYDCANVSSKRPPPLIPRKPANIELLQISRSSVNALNQLNNKKIQPEDCRGTIIFSSTNKRSPTLAVTFKSSSISAIQENTDMLKGHNVTQSPNVALRIRKFSPPPPPLMPRMQNVQQPQNSLHTFSNNSNKFICMNNYNSKNEKSKCNSEDLYLPRQSLEKETRWDSDHISYKMALHSNEDTVTTNKAPYDILSQTPELHNNLPDILPLGAELKPLSNTSLNPSLLMRCSSNNDITFNAPTTELIYSTHSQQKHAQQQSKQLSFTPVLNTFNLSSNFTRSQSFDTNIHNAMNQSSTKCISQPILDLKKPINNLETTTEESNLLNIAILKENSSPLSALSSLSEICNNPEDKLTVSLIGNNMNTATSIVPFQTNSIFRAELINTTFVNNNSNNCNTTNKNSAIRQESLSKNIAKTTQLQSQLMSAHITDNAFLANCTLQVLPQSNFNITCVENDVRKSQETMKIEEKKSLSNTGGKSLPTDPLTPPPAEKVSANNCIVKSPKILEKEHGAEISILSKLDSSTDSLKLVQRSEIMLRVSTTTVETASQTDDITNSELRSLSENTYTNTDTASRTTLQPRQRLPIENVCDKLSKEMANMLMPNDALIHILCPPASKTVADYVTNLYNPNVPLRSSKRVVGTFTLAKNTRNKEEEDSNFKVNVALNLSELAQMPINCDILKKKKVDDLIKNFNYKICILTKELSCIGDESTNNDELGDYLLNKLSDKVRPIEASKCRTYISDIGHITGLLLSLSERLVKAENILMAIDHNNSEKIFFENKRDRLLEQLTEAKRLKEGIDRRGVSVLRLLEKNLSSNDFADFEYFTNLKAKLITDAREVANKIKIGEEIIRGLSDTLMQSNC